MKALNLFKNTLFKSIILAILPIAYSCILTLATSIFLNNISLRNKLFASCIILFVIHIIALILYGINENKLKNRIKQKEREQTEVNELKELLSTYGKVVFDVADKLYSIVQLKHSHTDIQDWDWIQARGDAVCDAVYRFVKDVAEYGDNFSVSLIFKKVDNKRNGYTMSSRTGSENSSLPMIYRSFVTEEEAKDKYYKKLLDDAEDRPSILLTKADIKQHFDSSANFYRQYIGIPISCTGRKTIGLLQIAAYEGACLSNNRDVVEHLCNNYFELAGKIMLLSDKTENIQQVINELLL